MDEYKRHSGTVVLCTKESPVLPDRPKSRVLLQPWSYTHGRRRSVPNQKGLWNKRDGQQ